MKKIIALLLFFGLCLGLALPSYASLDDGLEIYYAFDPPFDNNNKILDLSGNDRMGSTHGNVQQAEGILGYAAMFDGNGDYISGPSVDVGTGDFTVCFWFKTTDTMGYMIDSRLWDGKGYYLIMYNSSVNWGIQGGQEQYVQAGGYTDDQWHLAVGVREGSWIGLYLDRELVGNNSGQDALDVGNSQLCIGKRFSVQNNSQYYSGLIDDFRLYSRALSTDEVQELYNMSQVPIPATIWLMASGLFGLVGVRKKVNNQKT